MINDARLATRNVCLVLAAVFCSALASAASGAAADGATEAVQATPAAQEPLQQLDEVWIRGKRLSRVIEGAEDDFFKLYNKLNKKDTYDIHCGYMSLSRGSMIMKRTCAPDFLTSDRSTSFYNSGYSFARTPVQSMCYGPMLVDGGVPYYEGGCYGSAPVAYAIPIPALVSAPASLMLMEHRKAYADNVLNVINSNPQLLEKYTQLVGLYEELRQTQSRYVKVRKADKAGSRELRSAQPGWGPRGM